MSDQPQGNGAPGASQGQGAPGALSEEQLTKMIADVANQAFTGRSKQLKKELLEEFGKGLEPISKQISDLVALQGSQQPGGKGKKKDDDPDGGTPEYRGLQKQLADQKAAFDKLQGELTAEKSRAAESAMRTKVSDELVRHGIDAARARRAMQILVDGDKSVRLDDDGQVVGIDTDGQPIDLPTFVKGWVKGEDAKIFLPPTGARGSGGMPGTTASKQQQGQPDTSATELGLAFAREFGGMPVPLP